MRELSFSARETVSVPVDDGLWVGSVLDWVGSAVDRIEHRRDMYRKVLDRWWAASGNARFVPRTPLDAFKHLIYYMEGTHPTQYWTDSGMAMVARAYGVEDPMTSRIPQHILGHRHSAARQFRWLLHYHPEHVVQSSNNRGFGYEVPLGAVLYWDDSRGGNGTGQVGIAAGYRGDVLMQLCSVPEPGCRGDHDRSGLSGNHPSLSRKCLHVGLKAAPRHGTLGWTLPVFYAPPQTVASNLWDSTPKESTT